MEKPMLKNYSTFFGGYAKIYTLSTIDGNVFYVGCTVCSIEERVSSHIIEARTINKYNKNNRKSNYLREIGLKFTAEIIDMVWVTGLNAKYAMNKASLLEREYINKYRDLGYDLVNHQPLLTLPKDEPQYIGRKIIINNGKLINTTPNPCLTY